MLESVNRQNFYDQLNRFSTSQLEDLTKQYPYQHELQLLLAKKYQLEDNPAFDEQLQIAAIYAQDRELFYSLFNEKQQEFVTEEPVKVVQVESDNEPYVPTVEQPVIEPVAEQPVMAQPVEETPVQEVAVEQPIAVAAEPTIEEAVETQAAGEMEAAVEEENLTEGEHTFDEWLTVFNKTKAAIADAVSEAAEEPEEDDLDKLILQNTPVNLHELVEEETQYSRGLEEFIGEQIRKKKKVEVKKTKNENQMDPSLATETLAKLYEMQRKYASAIRTYEALTLKFPEKSDFFAARINYLKNLM